jgi:thiol-disulfide isomerase/thioredoxin
MKNLLATLCGVVLLAGCVNTSKSNRPLRVLQDAPEFSLKNVLGGELKSADLKGKVVIADIWATWCVPCKVEIPGYNELRAKYKDMGVEFVGITYDSGSMEKVKPYLKDLEIQYPVVMGTDEVDAAFGGHPGYPTTILIGKDWKVYRKIIGSVPAKKAMIEKDILALLEKPDSLD